MDSSLKWTYKNIKYVEYWILYFIKCRPFLQVKNINKFISQYYNNTNN